MIRPDYRAVVTEHWGEDAPAWVLALADACQVSSQTLVARKISYSAPVVSAVLRNSYRGMLGGVEEAVRGAYMNGTVDCPALGPIPGQVCVEHRRNSVHFVNSNLHRVRMYRACRGCPRNQTGEKS